MTNLSTSLDVLDPSSLVADSACWYFTIAKNVWLLVKVVGLEYPSGELEAIRGIEGELKKMFSS